MQPAKKIQVPASEARPIGDQKTSAKAASDASIVARVLGGEVDAYRLLIEKYQSAMVACAWQRLHTREDAEEAAQEAFVQAFERLKKLREPRFFFTWLWRICANTAVKMHRKARRHRLGLVEEAQPAAFRAAPIEIDERNRALLHALAALPEDQRTALTLRFWEGMAYGEMADLLGLSHDALYQRVSRGLKQVRDLLGDDFLDQV